jgi:hypothetical protein
LRVGARPAAIIRENLILPILDDVLSRLVSLPTTSNRLNGSPSQAMRTSAALERRVKGNRWAAPMMAPLNRYCATRTLFAAAS